MKIKNKFTGVLLCLALGEDITGIGDGDSEQWMEKMLKDFQGLQKNDA